MFVGSLFMVVVVLCGFVEMGVLVLCDDEWVFYVVEGYEF